MRIYKKNNVYDEALDRIRWLYDEFPNVVVGVSGGKDSTVVFNLCLIVAREKGRLPLKVLFIDQEAEWQATIDQIKRIMYNPDVEAKWYQMPLRLFNATSTTDHWLNCWRESDKDLWIREKDDISIKDNIYDEDRFIKLFPAIFKKEYPDTKTTYIAGVRVEESPARAVGLTYGKTYKWATWGTILNRKLQHYTMYPIYDWSVSDVWKAIHDNKWAYNEIYDYQYRYGLPIQKMRVSNVHHETAVTSLFYMQELEPETHNKLTKRLQGIDSAAKFGFDNYFVNEVPFMFKDWKEYRDHLLDKLIEREDWKERFVEKFKAMEIKYDKIRDISVLHKVQCQSILVNDWEFIKLTNFEKQPGVHLYRKWKRGEKIKVMNKAYSTHLPEGWEDDNRTTS